MSQPVLLGDGLVRRFDAADVVAGASLEILAGESVALLGPSGCGKTTLLQILGLLDRPNAGRVLLAGTDAWREGAAARAWLRLRHIGFVFQQHNLLVHLSARENVALPAWRLGGSRRAALAAADELLQRFGLAARAAAPAAVLSTGESQRVAIARALVNRPEVVLADEPTGSLDTTSSASVLDALDRGIEGGAALLVVTHDPAVAARMHRTVTMRDGRLAPAPPPG